MHLKVYVKCTKDFLYLTISYGLICIKKKVSERYKVKEEYIFTCDAVLGVLNFPLPCWMLIPYSSGIESIDFSAFLRLRENYRVNEYHCGRTVIFHNSIQLLGRQDHLCKRQRRME